jgi:hypothetical protein
MTVSFVTHFVVPFDEGGGDEGIHGDRKRASCTRELRGASVQGGRFVTARSMRNRSSRTNRDLMAERLDRQLNVPN